MKLTLLVFTLLVWLAPVPLMPAATSLSPPRQLLRAGDGQTSLNEAIQVAQAGDTIAFNIPGAGPHTIKHLSAAIR